MTIASYYLKYYVEGVTTSFGRTCKTYDTKELADTAFQLFDETGWSHMDDGISVYARHKDGTVEWLCDCAIQKDADLVLSALEFKLNMTKLVEKHYG